MADTKTMFLDYDGLKTFWSLINAKFVAGGKVEFAENGSAVFTLTTGTGESIAMGELPIATKDNPGLMSAAQAETVNNFAEGVNAVVPFIGMSIDGKDVTISDARKSDIKLVLEDETVTTGEGDNQVTTTKTYITLKDTATGSAAFSRIDVSRFIVDGLLANEELVVEGGKTYIKFTWNLADGTTKDELIDVTSLIDTYLADEKGLTLTDHTFSLKLDGNTLVVSDNGVKVNTDVIATVDYVDGKVKTATDALDNYYTKEEINTTLADYDTSTEVDDKVKVATDAAAAVAKDLEDNYYDATTIDGKIGELGEGETVVGKITAVAKDLEDNYYDKTSINNTLADYDTSTEVDDKVKVATDAAAAVAKDLEDNYYDKTSIGELGEGETVVGKISAVAKDLEDNYYTKEEINTTLADYDTSTEVDDKVKVAKDAADAVATDLSTNYYDKTKVDELVDEAKTAAGNVDSKLANYYTKEEVNGITGDINATIGTVTEGKTVVAMIGDAETAAKAYTDEVFASFVAITDDEIKAIVNGTADSGDGEATA